MRPDLPRALPKRADVLGSPLRNLLAVLGFVTVVIVTATGCYMAAGWGFADALYMVLLTVYTVGYREVRPIDTNYLHALTIGTMVLGCTGMILLTSALVQVFTAMELRELYGGDRMQTRIDRLSGHVIICGYGRIGFMLAEELRAAGKPLVVVEQRPGRLAEAEAGAAGCLCVAGDATDEDVLRAAGVARARILATVLPDDAANVFITLSARTLNPALEIIARGEAPSTERKLLQAGADRVVLPAHTGAEQIARMILYPASGDLRSDAVLGASRLLLEELGLELEKTVAHPGAPLCGITVAQAEALACGGFFIVQIDRGAQVFPRPSRDQRIEPEDQLLIVVRDTAAAARALFATSEPAGQI